MLGPRKVACLWNSEMARSYYSGQTSGVATFQGCKLAGVDCSNLVIYTTGKSIGLLCEYLNKKTSVDAKAKQLLENHKLEIWA